jgi:hypothetical protein
MDREAVRRLVNLAEQSQKKALAEQKKVFGKRVADLVTSQKKALAKQAMLSRRESSRIRASAQEKARQDRVLFDQEFARLRGAYQMSLAQMRESQSRQNLVMLNELKDLMGTYFEEGTKHFNSVVETNHGHIQDILKWLQDELPGQLVESVSQRLADGDLAEIGTDAKTESSSESRGRDEAIEKAEARIRDLEERLTSKEKKTIWKRMRRSSAEPYKEAEPVDPQQEVLRMIREIAHERDQMERTRGNTSQRNSPQFADSFGSTMSKSIAL